MKNEEVPASARASKRFWAFWKMVKKLTPNEIEFLISKRMNELKYEKDYKEIRNLKTEICILEDAYEIMNKR